MHYIESVPRYLTLQVFLTSIADMQVTAKEWAELLLRRLLNAEDTRATLSVQINLLDERNRLILISMLHEIKSDGSDQIKARVSEVLTATYA